MQDSGATTCACSYHDVPFLQHVTWFSLTCVCQQEASNNSNSGIGSSRISSGMGNMISSQDKNLWLKELPCWPHGFQLMMISTHIIIIFMNIKKGILEWWESKNDNLNSKNVLTYSQKYTFPQREVPWLWQVVCSDWTTPDIPQSLSVSDGGTCPPAETRCWMLPLQQWHGPLIRNNSCCFCPWGWWWYVYWHVYQRCQEAMTHRARRW
jgi:hypothetical protein